MFDPELQKDRLHSWSFLPVECCCKSIGIRIKIQVKNYLRSGLLPVIDQGSEFISGYTNTNDSNVTDELPVVIFGDHTRVLKYVDFMFAAGADGIKVLRPYEFFEPKLFFRFLQAIELPNKGYARHFKHIKNSIVPIPPLNEQKRIANKLDDLLGRVDACHERLERVPFLLKRFRQSVLAAAVSGKLTEDWRKRLGISRNEEVTDIQSVAIVGTGSTPLRSNTNFYADNGVPWITSAATSNPFISEANEFVTQQAVKSHRLKLYPVGTLLVAMYGEGKTRGQVSELTIEATINQACAAIVVNDRRILKDYLKIVLKANYLEMRSLAEGGNQPNLNLSKIKDFSFSIPTIVEQDEIVRRVNILYKYADRLDSHLRESVEQVQRLMPSLLVKAFRGELVSQDPNDEPAAELLTRIQKHGLETPIRNEKPRKKEKILAVR